ncbi:dynactin-associated protein [Acomys russatus]|uniref:dynactin-associated protein n=1 Tax=Acomys russatus TaxID=60746 RepID=UPI0021E2CD01|nr:dynactin-associated protein [Acomys russatus]
MERKHGKYVVNVEHAGEQQPSTCSHGQEAQPATHWCPPLNDVAGNVSSNLSGVWVSPTVLEHSECQHPEPHSAQVARNGCGDWSLCKVFLASLLASVITTAIGVLILSLVNRNNPPIVIQLTSNTDTSTLTPGTTSITSQTTVATSTGSTTTTTSPETTATTATIVSTEPARTSTSTQPSTSAASTETRATTTRAMTSTQPVTTADTTSTSSVSTSTAASTQPTASATSTGTSATTMDSTQPVTTSTATSS